MRLAGSVQVLPSARRVVAQNPMELRHFYEDIFEKRVYAKNGITLPEAAVVLDIGANVGLFTIFVQERWPSARVFCFEPSPPTYRLLCKNTVCFGSQVKRFNMGLAAVAGEAELTFYPNSSGMSSFYADEAEEREVLTAILENEAEDGNEEVRGLMAYLDDYLTVRLQAETYTCPLSTVSRVLREEGLSRVDLIKMDVQKAEWEILQGIAADDWPKIRQIVIEVHDLEGRVEKVTGLLAARGFSVTAEQDRLYGGSAIYNLYAIRQG
jgi:phthiocerol/phenolphthiocerol synthesis type-I polyketide synthase E